METLVLPLNKKEGEMEMEVKPMVKPMIKVKELEMEDPTFEGGSTHTARALLENPTAKQFTYDLSLYLDVTKVAEATGSIIIPAGGSVYTDFALLMPLVEGEYEGWLDVFCVDAITAENPFGLIEHYHLTENIIIVISPGITIGPIIWV